ncbi:MAG: hypothetical protein ACHQ1H_08835, partial [Nitrososphaerales archaeon]
LRNQTTDYNEILIKAGFNEVKDAEYGFPIPRELTKDWREIPAFRSSKMPQEVSEEIRKEFEKVQDDSTSQDTSRWNIMTAENA